MSPERAHETMAYIAVHDDDACRGLVAADASGSYPASWDEWPGCEVRRAVVSDVMKMSMCEHFLGESDEEDDC